MVYEPHRVLRGLQGVGFQGKKCFTKMVSNFSEINSGFTYHEKKLTENSNMTFWYMPRSIDTNFLVVYEPCRALEGLLVVEFQGKNCLTKMASNFSETDFGFS